MSVTPVVYSTNTALTDLLSAVNPGIGLMSNAAQQSALTSDLLIRGGLVIGGLAAVIGAIVMMAREGGPNLIAKALSDLAGG